MTRRPTSLIKEKQRFSFVSSAHNKINKSFTSALNYWSRLVTLYAGIYIDATQPNQSLQTDRQKMSYKLFHQWWDTYVQFHYVSSFAFCWCFSHCYSCANAAERLCLLPCESGKKRMRTSSTLSDKKHKRWNSEKNTRYRSNEVKKC